ncbi:MAG: hypothetical protein ACR2RF_31035, partial [Geminicoccaceae bacterium]
SGWRTLTLQRSGPRLEDGFIGNEPEGVVEREDDAAERQNFCPSVPIRLYCLPTLKVGDHGALAIASRSD